MTDYPEAVIAAGNALRQRWIDERLPIASLSLDPMDWATTALEAAAPHIAAAERERIRQLATSHAADGAKCAKGVAVRPTCQCATWNPRFPFAHLLTKGDT